MADSIVVFITGVSRGIGKTLAESYLSRPNHIVIGSVRDKTPSKTQALEALPVAAGSRLLLVSIESSSFGDPAKAIKDIEAAGVDHLDVVIANAGGSTELAPVESVSVEDMTECFNANTLGPLILFQAVKPLLEKSKSPKFVTVSTVVGSIGIMEKYNTYRAAAYGVSKAGLNWLTVAVHCGNKWLTAIAIHPGLVQTELGNMGAKALGFEKAPTTQEESVAAITSFIDQATREKSSGKFFNVIDGAELPW